MPMLIVQLSAFSKLQKHREIRAVNSNIIQWGKKKSYSAVEAMSAFWTFCVKCDIPHGPGECQLKIEGSEDRKHLYCVLCKSRGHPASYRGCTKYLELKNKLISKTAQIKINASQRSKMFANFGNENVSFSGAVHWQKQKPMGTAATNLQQDFLTKLKI